MMNRSHPNFGLKTKISEKEWWRKLIRGNLLTQSQSVVYFYPDDLKKILQAVIVIGRNTFII